MPESTLFIPDISGFTRFVKQTEISHSQHIIQELINLIIEKGSQSMEVAEVEGDAVFFYKKGVRMSVEDLTLEAQRIFQAFHTHLLDYEHRRICSCGACSTAVDLKLKFVVHAGEIGMAAFSGRGEKPFGGPVIAAHRLLKNEIDHDEYILFSDAFLADSGYLGDGEGFVEDRDLGRVNYQYTTIDQWKEGLEVEVASQPEVKPHMVVEATATIPQNIDTLQNFIMDFRYRHLWNKEADEVIYDEDLLNRSGTEHYCVVKGKHLFFDTVKPKVEPNQRSYGEILKNPAPLKFLETDFLMTPISYESTWLTFRMALSVKWWMQRILLPLMKKRLEKKAREVLQDIRDGLQEMTKEAAEAETLATPNPS
ncbi:MAG: DUF2652 domain-containing protein [Bacteroidota bacterium]